MLAAGGYLSILIPLQRRDACMAALEDASVRQNIAPFADFLAQLVEGGCAAEPLPKHRLSTDLDVDTRTALSPDDLGSSSNGYTKVYPLGTL